MKVREVMTTDVVTVREDTPLKEAARLLAGRGISGLPVVDAAGAVLGVLSEADILVKEGGDRERHGGLLGWLLEPGEPWLDDKLTARTAGEAMTAPALTIEPDRSVRDAAVTMLEEGVNRLPVVDPGGLLLGLVSRGDLVRAFARSDEEIRTEIETEVLRRTLWLSPGDVRVSVEDGVVTLQGAVDTEADAELLPTFVRRVPGVVAVTADITARGRGHA